MLNNRHVQIVRLSRSIYTIKFIHKTVHFCVCGGYESVEATVVMTTQRANVEFDSRISVNASGTDDLRTVDCIEKLFKLNPNKYRIYLT